MGAPTFLLMGCASRPSRETMALSATIASLRLLRIGQTQRIVLTGLPREDRYSAVFLSTTVG
jgi:hypothetical protein